MPYFEKGNINRQVELLVRDMSTWTKCPNCKIHNAYEVKMK